MPWRTAAASTKSGCPAAVAVAGALSWPARSRRRAFQPASARASFSPARRAAQHSRDASGTDSRSSRSRAPQLGEEPGQDLRLQVGGVAAVPGGQGAGGAAQPGQRDPAQRHRPRRVTAAGAGAADQLGPHRVAGGSAGRRVQQQHPQLIDGNRPVRQPGRQPRGVHGQRPRPGRQQPERGVQNIQRAERSSMRASRSAGADGVGAPSSPPALTCRRTSRRPAASRRRPRRAPAVPAADLPPAEPGPPGTRPRPAGRPAGRPSSRWPAPAPPARRHARGRTGHARGRPAGTAGERAKFSPVSRRVTRPPAWIPPSRPREKPAREPDFRSASGKAARGTSRP